jgi:prophage regulatory protein
MRFIRKIRTAEKVGYHPSHVMRLVRQKKFPQPVRLGPNSVAFVEDEVDEWMRARLDERDMGGSEQ